jgi:hypothetical protein
MFCYFIGKPWKKLYFWTSPGRRQAEEPPRVAVDVSAQSKGRPWLHLSAPRWWYERSTTDGATGAWVRKVIFELKFHVLGWFLSPLSLLLLIFSYVLLYVLLCFIICFIICHMLYYICVGVCFPPSCPYGLTCQLADDPMSWSPFAWWRAHRRHL